ncbi:phage regulatory CII family protein [Pseudomonas indica]|uniref:Phage regulatory protein CII (CP76) n=1 Tax=Pseudomonas indica TaxID=137658 RepID=A0A1G8V391_9PSED|nr:phage regulatory CII family protein [Pseudomonas indica]SDJ60469.1 hypothetical protein SAMN05216186_10282 [Pseudomonas indica]
MGRTVFGCVERARREILPLELALYHAVREYPGGAAAVAATVGRNATTLQHKLSPTHPTHTLNVAELEEILPLTRDPRVMDSLCMAFGDAIWLDVRDLQPGSSPASLVSGIGEMLRRESDLAGQVAASLEDNRIDLDELAELELLTVRMAQAVFGLLFRARQQHAEGQDNG